MNEENYELWCLLEKHSNIFKIYVAPHKDMFDVKEIISQVLRQDSAASVYLTLTKVNVDISVNRKVILTGKYQPNADEKDGSIVGNETVSEIWPKNPPRGHLSIFIRDRSPNTVLGKHIRSVDEPQSSKVVDTPPSQMTTVCQDDPFPPPSRRVAPLPTTASHLPSGSSSLPSAAPLPTLPRPEYRAPNMDEPKEGEGEEDVMVVDEPPAPRRHLGRPKGSKGTAGIAAASGRSKEKGKATTAGGAKRHAQVPDGSDVTNVSPNPGAEMYDFKCDNCVKKGVVCEVDPNGPCKRCKGKKIGCSLMPVNEKTGKTDRHLPDAKRILEFRIASLKGKQPACNPPVEENAPSADTSVDSPARPTSDLLTPGHSHAAPTLIPEPAAAAASSSRHPNFRVLMPKPQLPSLKGTSKTSEVRFNALEARLAAVEERLSTAGGTK